MDKSFSSIAIVVATAVFFAVGCSREDAAAVIQDARTTVGEAITPELGNPDKTLVVRQAKLKERRRQNTTWTEENIARHPELYLRQCQEDVKAAIEQYDAALITARRIRNENSRIVEESKKEIDRLSRFVEEAKPVFANPDTVYPVKVSGFTFSKEQFTKQLRNALKDRKRRQEVAASASQRLTLAEARISQFEKAKEDAEDALRSLDAKLADVKANTALTGVGGIKDSVASILDTAGAVQTDFGDLTAVIGLPSAAESDDAFIRAELGL